MFALIINIYHEPLKLANKKSKSYDIHDPWELRYWTHVPIRLVFASLLYLFSESLTIFNQQTKSYFFYFFYFFFLRVALTWTQVCSHIICYIPVPIGLLFALAPTHDWIHFHPRSCLRIQIQKSASKSIKRSACKSAK